MAVKGDKYPPPPGNVTTGTSAQRDVDRAYSEINPYAKELAIFRAEEFSKMDSPFLEDFLVGTSAWDGGRRYIRKTFIESVCPHKEGSIVRTFSGDFHVIEEDPRSFEYSLASRYAGRNTEEELLKTKTWELARTVDELVVRIEFLEKFNKETDND